MRRFCLSSLCSFKVNPVDNPTSEQIRDIYSKKTVDGNDLGGMDEKILRSSITKVPADQRNEQATFVMLNIVDTQSHPTEIVTPNGITIKLTDASPQYVAELPTVLASC